MAVMAFGLVDFPGNFSLASNLGLVSKTNKLGLKVKLYETIEIHHQKSKFRHRFQA